MERCTGCRDMTEIILTMTLYTIQLISQLNDLKNEWFWKHCGKGKNCWWPVLHVYTVLNLRLIDQITLSVMGFNPLPDMPILGSSNSTANKDMMSNVWTNGDTIIWLSGKPCGKRRNCSLWAISSFPIMLSKAVCCWCVKMSICGVKG